MTIGIVIGHKDDQEFVVNNMRFTGWYAIVYLFRYVISMGRTEPL